MLRTFAADDPGSWEPLLEFARTADRAGVDTLLVSDHVVFGEDLEAYARPERGGIAGGKQPTGPDGHWLEPLTALAVVAGSTTRVRLGINILLAALRRPVVLAKTAATLDVLSGGRLDLGVGVGWQREEYVAAGLDYSTRGRLLDHTLAVCQTLWRDQRATFADDELEFDGIHMMPKPLQPGGVPIWVSGRINDAVVRRLARFGSGWIPWGDEQSDLLAAIGRMREAVAAAGRDPSDLGVAANLPLVKDDAGQVDLGATMAPVPELVAAGVTQVRFPLGPRKQGDTEQHLADVVGAFRDAAR